MAKKVSSKLPAKRDEEAALVAAQSLEADAGQGFENQTRDDITIPVVYLLQQMSPQLETIDGAKAGMMMNSVTEELYKEFLFVPATTTHEYVEYVPRSAGGGFVGVHALNSDVVKRCKATQPFGVYRLDNGNELIEHFSVFGVIVDEEQVQSFAVIRFKSTKIKVYKQFNTRMQTCMIPRADGNGKFNPSINAHVIRVSTVKQKNSKGEFWNFQLSSAVDNNMIASLMTADDPRYQAARDVRELVNADKVQASYEDNVGRDDVADDDTPF